MNFCHVVDFESRLAAGPDGLQDVPLTHSDWLLTLQNGQSRAEIKAKLHEGVVENDGDEVAQSE